MKKIAIFASGAGSNAEQIIRHFEQSQRAKVELILCNRPQAGVLERAERLGVRAVVFDRDTFYNTDEVVRLMQNEGIDFVVLAGFLWLVPQNIIDTFRGRILNVHPALLPRHGGKGMYGDRVHQAVVAAGDTETGITIHQVNEVYDSGNIVAQFRVSVDPSDTPEQVAHKVHALEYAHFPETIDVEIQHVFASKL